MQKKIIILCTVILIVVMEALFALIGALMPARLQARSQTPRRTSRSPTLAFQTGATWYKTDETAHIPCRATARAASSR